MTHTASHDWKSAYPRQPKSAARYVRFVNTPTLTAYRFLHPRYDAYIEAVDLAELNDIIVELGYCPVRPVAGGGFTDDTEE